MSLMSRSVRVLRRIPCLSCGLIPEVLRCDAAHCYHIEIRPIPGTTELICLHVREYGCHTVVLADSDVAMEAQRFIFSIVVDPPPSSTLIQVTISDAR